MTNVLKRKPSFILNSLVFQTNIVYRVRTLFPVSCPTSTKSKSHGRSNKCFRDLTSCVIGDKWNLISFIYSFTDTLADVSRIMVEFTFIKSTCAYITVSNYTCVRNDKGK